MAHHLRRASGLLLALSGLLFIGAHASSALGAEYGIAPGGFTVEMLDAEGNPENIAGSHPDRLRINFALDVEGTSTRDIEFELPPGLAGNPTAVPQCARQIYENEEECPPQSQVGVFELRSGGASAKLPMFELEPKPGQILTLGTKSSLDLPLKAELRADDFGITLKGSDLPKTQAVEEGHFELWGVPADHQEGTGIPRRSFLTTPSTCEPMVFGFRTRSWQEGAPWLSASADTGGPLSGCEELGFDPRLGMQLSNPVADSPTGLRMDLSVPEEDAESERAEARIEGVTVEMPSGIGVSPAGVEGLTACSDSQLGLGTSAEAQCPASAKLGTAEFSAPALGVSLTGTIYLGQEHPGQRFRVFVVAAGSGTVFKSVGTLRTDPVTGRLSTVLEHLPQVPIQRISLVFDGGAGALLASPLECGPATAVARFEPYGGGPAVGSTASVPIESRTDGGRCTGPPPFAPQLVASTSTRRAGRPTAMSMTLRRQPGEQVPRKFSVTLPVGMSAALGSVQACSEVAALVAACPPGSRIGSVLAEVGSGPDPTALRGSVYVTAPYRRAPFGLLTEFHGAIGPFDLGTIVMRGAAELDRRSGRATVSMGGLPEQVEGVPIRFQSIELSMDRPGLVRNPTSCSPKSTDASFESQSGVVATATSPFALHGCDRLGFKPDMQVELLGGRRELRAHGHPGVRVSVRLRQGDAALRGMTLSLPSALAFGVGGLKEICSRQDAIEGACSSASRIGSASARSSLLSRPLSGSVYIAQPAGNGPPDIWVSLAVMGVHVDIESETHAHNGHFVTKLTGLPDMPLSELTMRLGTGASRIFSLGVGPCQGGRTRRFISTVDVEGQNGARRTLHPRIGTRERCTGLPRPRPYVPGRRASAPANTE